MKLCRGRRSNTLIYTQITASLPFIEVDLNLTPAQMLMLINGLKYIRPCQSQYSRQSVDELLTQQYKNIRTIVEQCLDENRMSKTDTRAQQAFSELERIIYDLKLKRIPRKLRLRARREYKIVRSIQRLLRQRTRCDGMSG